MFWISDLFSQSLSETEKMYYIGQLNSDEETDRFFALQNIEKYSIKEAEDTLLSKIWDDDVTMQIEYLEALKAINYPLTYNLTLDYLDTLTSNPQIYSQEYLLEYRVQAVAILFDYGDYSLAKLVFDLLERDKPELNSTAFYLLDEILENCLEFEEKAKVELLKVLRNPKLDFYKIMALRMLFNKYGDRYYNEAKIMAEQDQNLTYRIIALEDFIIPLKKDDLNSYLKSRLLNESDETIRFLIARNFSNLFPSSHSTFIIFAPFVIFLKLTSKGALKTFVMLSLSFL